MALIDPLVRTGVRAAGSDVPEKTELRVGFIPPTDCASVVMASTLGFDKKYGIKITPSREASWAGVRNRLVLGDLDTAHVLYSLIYGIQLGVGDPERDMAVLMTPNNNGQTITLSSKLKETDVRDGASLKAVMAEDKREYVFMQTFLIGTHTMRLYYWLAAHGIHPLQDTKAVIVPPPWITTNVRVGNMDSYCVSEPWDAHATADSVGFTAETTQAIWKDHPERILGTTTGFVREYPNTVRALTAAVLETSKLIGVSVSNRRKMTKTIATKSYVNTNVDVVLDRMLGRYTNGLGKTWDDPNPIRFYHNGVVNFPYLSGGMWFLTQHERWGLLKARPDYLVVTRQVNRVDILEQAAAATGTPLPESGIRTAKLIDGVVWGTKNPAACVDGFKLKT